MIRKYLTSNYNKNPKSNITKVSRILSDEIQEVIDLFNKIEQYDDVNVAKGKALDHIGENILQYRGEVNDEIYRALIKAKIAKNRADGTLNNLLDILAITLETDIKEISLVEGEHPIYPSVKMLAIPFDTLNSIGMSVSQLALLINKLIGAGITLESLVFDGTFQYVDELYNDLDTGYADVDMLSGGTYGDVYKPERDDQFPI